MRIRTRRTIPVVHDDAFKQLLEKLDLRADMEAGKLHCAKCGRILTLGTTGFAYQRDGETLLHCSSAGCALPILSYEETADPVQDHTNA